MTEVYLGNLIYSQLKTRAVFLSCEITLENLLGLQQSKIQAENRGNGQGVLSTFDPGCEIGFNSAENDFQGEDPT